MNMKSILTGLVTALTTIFTGLTTMSNDMGIDKFSEINEIQISSLLVGGVVSGVVAYRARNLEKPN